MRTRKLTRIFWLVTLVMLMWAGSTPAADQGQTPVDKININTATAEMLTQLNGIGRAYADRIIEYRETNGLFSHIEEIKNVKGIGERIFEKNKDRITVEVETGKATNQ